MKQILIQYLVPILVLAGWGLLSSLCSAVLAKTTQIEGWVTRWPRAALLLGFARRAGFDVWGLVKDLKRFADSRALIRATLGSLLVGCFLMFACSAASTSRAKQTADLLCASIAGSLHAVKGDPASERLMIACLDRLERNEAIEDAIALAASGGSFCAVPVGVAGAPDWLPMRSTGTAGAVQ